MNDRECSTEEGRWIYPDEYEAGQPSPSILRTAFWEAVTRCEDKFSYVGSESNGDAGTIDSHIPDEVWEHMAGAIAELRAAAGLDG